MERLIRRKQVIRGRQNPFLNYSEDEFIDRYRLNKECVLTILAEIRDSLEPKQKKLSSISPLHQFLIALRFYGTGSPRQNPDRGLGGEAPWKLWGFKELQTFI